MPQHRYADRISQALSQIEDEDEGKGDASELIAARLQTPEWYWLLGHVSRGAIVWDETTAALNSIAP